MDIELIMILLLSITIISILTVIVTSYIVRKNKKKRIILKPTSWENDILFLEVMIKRKIEPLKKYYIDLLSSQKEERDMIKDNELEGLYIKTSIDIYESLNASYIDMLEKVYFSKEKVLEYIAESVYYILSTLSIDKNISKIESMLLKKRTKFINELNESISENTNNVDLFGY